MEQPSDRIESLIESRYQDPQQQNREVAIRHALGLLDPKSDDGQQGYVALLQRLQAAITQELARMNTLPPVSQEPEIRTFTTRGPV